MSDPFQYEVFLTHSAKDKAVVRPLAERLRHDMSELPPSAFCFLPFLCASLNRERRFIPLRLDDDDLGCRRSLEIRDPWEAKAEILAASCRENT
jgi:hypothetical protein